MTRLEHARKVRQRINVGLSGAIKSGAIAAADLGGVVERWRPGRKYTAGEVCEAGGKLYRCAQAHTSQSDWTPATVPALWVDIGVTADDPEAVPEWIQPTGAHDAYAKGAKVHHNGKTWTSDVDANTWEPGVANWTESAEGEGTP